MKLHSDVGLWTWKEGPSFVEPTVGCYSEYWLTSEQAKHMFGVNEFYDALGYCPRTRGCKLYSRLDLHKITGLPNPFEEYPKHSGADL